MSDRRQTESAREVVGVFSDADALDAATADLQALGFDRTSLTMLASERAVLEKLGHHYEKVEELEDDPDVPHVAFRSRNSVGAEKNVALGALVSIGAVAAAGAIFAAGGALAATLGTGVIGAEVGVFLGGVLGDFIDAHHAHYLQQQLDHGGLLLFVRAANAEEERIAKDALERHSGRDVHAHELPVGA